MDGKKVSGLPRVILAFVLSCLMVWGGLPAPALAEMQAELSETPPSAENATKDKADEMGSESLSAPPTQEQVATQSDTTPASEGANDELTATFSMPPVTSDDATDSQDLFASYVDHAFDAALPSPKTLSTQSAYDNLSELDQSVFDALHPLIAEVAAGDEASTRFEFPVDKFAGKTSWTADELGVESIVVDGVITQEAVQAVMSSMVGNTTAVYNALVRDLPYELYWHAKANGMSIENISVELTHPNDEWVLTVTNTTIAYRFSVGADYADSSGQPYTVDTAKGKAVQSAVEYAGQIADEHANEPARQRLESYRNAICSEVSYNDAAAQGSSATGVNPWQMIWVFDKDPDTTVVCEGYSKAFKYLCDRSGKKDIECLAVIGTMTGGKGAGSHMWNVVRMDDGKNYLVDVTNCDEETVGYPDQLFLAYDSKGTGSVEDGYSIPTTVRDIGYEYYQREGTTPSMVDVFGHDVLQLSTTAYVQPEDDGLVDLSKCSMTCPYVTLNWDGSVDFSNVEVRDAGGNPVDSYIYELSIEGNPTSVQKGDTITIVANSREDFSKGQARVTCKVGRDFAGASVSVEGTVFRQSDYENWTQFSQCLPIRVLADGQELRESYGSLIVSQKSYDPATGVLVLTLAPTEDSDYYGTLEVNCTVLSQDSQVDISNARVVIEPLGYLYSGDPIMPGVARLEVPVEGAGLLIVEYPTWLTTNYRNNVEGPYGIVAVSAEEGDGSGLTGTATGSFPIINPSTCDLAQVGRLCLEGYNRCDFENNKAWMIREGGVRPDVSSVDIEGEYDGQPYSMQVTKDQFDKYGLTLAYENNTSAGTGTVRLSNANSSIAQNFTIIDTMNIGEFIVGPDQYLGSMLDKETYVVSDPMPRPKIMDIPGLFEEGVDFEYVPVEEGQSELYTYEPHDDGTGDCTCTFRIRAKAGQTRYVGDVLYSIQVYNLKDLAANCRLVFKDPNAAYVYNGQEHYAAVQLLDENGQVLLDSEDEKTIYGNGFYLLYSEDRTSPGTVKVTVSTDGTRDSGYAGSVSATYQIAPYDISAEASGLECDGFVPVDADDPVQAIAALPFGVRLEDGYVDLRYGVDYSLAIPQIAKGAYGSYDVTITGKGNCTGSRTIPVDYGYNFGKTQNWSVWGLREVFTKQEYAEFDIDQVEPNIDFNGGGEYYYATKGVDYTITSSLSEDGVHGTYTITGKGKCFGTMTIDFIVSDDIVDFTKASVEPIPDQAYTGSAITPSVTVVYNDEVLTAGVDYEVSYSDNIDRGISVAEVTGRGAYSGTMYGNFEIKDPLQQAPEALWWGTNGGCVWWVDDQGAMTVAPASGSTGTLENSSEQSPEWSRCRDQVTQVTFAQGVVADTSLTNLFSYFGNIQSADLTNLDARNVTDISYMFENAYKLETVALGTQFTGAPIASAAGIFAYCSSLKNLDLSPLHTTVLTDMTNAFQYVQVEKFTIGADYRTDITDALPSPGWGDRKWWSKELRKWMSNSEIAAMETAPGTYELVPSGSDDEATDISGATIGSIGPQRRTGSPITPLLHGHSQWRDAGARR